MSLKHLVLNKYQTVIFLLKYISIEIIILFYMEICISLLQLSLRN